MKEDSGSGGGGRGTILDISTMKRVHTLPWPTSAAFLAPYRDQEQRLLKKRGKLHVYNNNNKTATCTKSTLGSPNLGVLERILELPSEVVHPNVRVLFEQAGQVVVSTPTEPVLTSVS